MNAANRLPVCCVVGLLALLSVSAAGAAQGASERSPRDLAALATLHYDRHYAAVLAEFAELLSLPNHAGNAGDIDRNLAALEKMLGRRGLAVKRLAVEGASPALYGELNDDPSRATVLFYAHYDGQPVGSGWKTPPFEPTLDRAGRQSLLRDELATLPRPDDRWRIYARSASDDKGAIVAMLTALDVLTAAKIPLPVNLKVFLEGEEEVGSPYLARIVRDNAALLSADLLLFADGPRHQSGRPQVVLGVRGIQTAQITLFGPNRALHSGHYGNWAPNPAARLTELLASLRGPDGHVRIAGFYDAVDNALANSGGVGDTGLGETELEDQLLRELGLAKRESSDRSLVRAVAWPALNIVGLQAGDTGPGARNAIPAEASASLDFRLVPAQTPGTVRRQLEEHLRHAGYRLVTSREEADAATDRDRVALVNWGRAGYSGARFREDAPPVRALIDVLRQLHGEELVVAPILGGSLPLSLFADNSPVSAVVVLPIANYDNNQHAPNENITLGSLRYGIEAFTAIFGALRIPAR